MQGDDPSKEDYRIHGMPPGQQPPEAKDTKPVVSGSVIDLTGENLWVRHKERLQQDAASAEGELTQIRKQLYELAGTGKDASTVREQLVEAIVKKLEAQEALEEARLLEQSDDTYVVAFGELPENVFGEFGVVDFSPDAPRLGLSLIIQLNRANDLETNLVSITHEASHAADFERGAYGIRWSGGHNPTYDSTDEQKAFRREKGLGHWSGVTIDHDFVITTGGYGGLWNRPDSRTLSSKVNVGGGRQIPLREHSERYLRQLGRQGKPLDSGVLLFKGWQDVYFDARLLGGHGLSY